MEFELSNLSYSHLDYRNINFLNLSLKWWNLDCPKFELYCSNLNSHVTRKSNLHRKFQLVELLRTLRQTGVREDANLAYLLNFFTYIRFSGVWNEEKKNLGKNLQDILYLHSVYWSLLWKGKIKTAPCKNFSFWILARDY